jgi:copper homeostasis protein
MLEICVFNIASAIAAEKAGANRLELCENYTNGGTTPSYGTLKLIRQKISIPVFVMIKPRGGDFYFSTEEYQAMQDDILVCKQLGYDGVVIGMLNKEGHIDIEKNKRLVQLAYPMEVTFHRAFDRCKDPLAALEDIIACGCTRLLTSGQQATAPQGQALLKQLIELAENRIIIMPGSGVNSKNIAALKSFTSAVEFHTSARKLVPHPIQFINHQITESHEIDAVNEVEINAIQVVLANSLI